MKHLLLLSWFFFLSPLIAQDNSASPTAEQTSNQEIAEFARKLLENQRATTDELNAGLRKIQNYVFRDTNAPEREYVLFAQGILEDKTAQTTRSVVTFRRFERAYPDSQYIPEVNFVFGRYALNQKNYKEAESRFQKVLDSDMPVESKFNAQGLLVWCLLEQKRMSDAIPLVETVFPIGRSKADERAFVAIFEVQCETKNLDAADKTRKAYISAFKDGTMKLRVNYAWGMLLVEAGRNVEAARALRDVMRDAPNSEQADEARLTMAIMIEEGNLPDKANPSRFTTESLIAQLRTNGVSGNVFQRAHLLQLHMAYKKKQWNNVLSLGEQYIKRYPNTPGAEEAMSYKIEITRNSVQNRIDSGGPFSAMPMLKPETVSMLTPELRANLVAFYVSKGLPEAATKLIDMSPESEKTDLRKALTQNISEPLPPPQVLTNLKGNLLGQKGELGEVNILLSAKKWNEASVRIEKLEPGANRITAVLALLTRPMTPKEIQLRIKEAEGWLAKCSENKVDIEPLAIHIADLYMQTNDPKSALELYPTDPQAKNKGWVSLMRAKAMVQLGQTENAKSLLKETASITDFKIYRQDMLNKLNR